MAFSSSQMTAAIQWLVVITILSIGQSARGQDLETLSAQSDGQTTNREIYSDIPQFGGPTSVAGQLAEDTTTAPQFRMQGLQDRFVPWYEFKERLNQYLGLQFGIDESMLFQVATASTGESEAASGIARVYGQWQLLGRDTGQSGMLVFKGETRHKIGSAISPFDMGFAAGSIVPTGTFFSDFHFAATNLFWKQQFLDGRATLVAGRIDLTDFIDVYAMTNPLTHFMNLSFSLNPTIAAPNQGLGVAFGAMLTDQIYVQTGLSDANGQPTQAGFNTFFNENEVFSYVEMGVTSGQDRIYLDNVHVTMWHTDDRQIGGTPEGWGMAFSAQKFVCDRWLPFLRFGFSNGDAALMQTSISTGIGYQRANRDVLGAGISWGKPTTGGLRDQITSELFYRFQLTEFLAITPDIQLIVDPALNPNVDTLAFFGIRLRAAF